MVVSPVSRERDNDKIVFTRVLELLSSSKIFSRVASASTSSSILPSLLSRNKLLSARASARAQERRIYRRLIPIDADEQTSQHRYLHSTPTYERETRLKACTILGAPLYRLHATPAGCCRHILMRSYNPTFAAAFSVNNDPSRI